MPTNAKPRQKPKSRKAAAETRALGFRLTNPDRIVYPEVGQTNRDVANYFVSVAKWMLPQIVGRPLSLVRCPEGLRGQCFFQKHPPVGLPAVVERIQIQEKSELRTYSVIQNLEGLIALVQFGHVGIPCLGFCAADVERPDRLVFDLDPDPSVAWKDVVIAARTLRRLLLSQRLRSFLKQPAGRDCIWSCQSPQNIRGWKQKYLCVKSPTAWWRRSRTNISPPCRRPHGEEKSLSIILQPTVPPRLSLIQRGQNPPPRSRFRSPGKNWAS